MAKEKSPCYQRYPNDYLTDENVMAMTLEEEGAYNRLMDFCWKEGSIPASIPGLAAMCKNVSEDRMRAIWKAVGRCFKKHPRQRGRLIHPRLEREREKQSKWRKQSAEAGKKGAAVRWGKHGQTIADPMATPMAKDDFSFAVSSLRKQTDSSPVGEVRGGNLTPVAQVIGRILPEAING